MKQRVFNEGFIENEIFEQLELETGKNLVKTMCKLYSLKSKWEVLENREVVDDQFEAETGADKPSSAAGTYLLGKKLYLVYIYRLHEV